MHCSAFELLFALTGADAVALTKQTALKPLKVRTLELLNIRQGP